MFINFINNLEFFLIEKFICVIQIKFIYRSESYLMLTKACNL